jgi:hypothetical protein
MVLPDGYSKEQLEPSNKYRRNLTTKLKTGTAARQTGDMGILRQLIRRDDGQQAQNKQKRV